MGLAWDSLLSLVPHRVSTSWHLKSYFLVTVAPGLFISAQNLHLDFFKVALLQHVVLKGLHK